MLFSWCVSSFCAYKCVIHSELPVFASLHVGRILRNDHGFCALFTISCISKRRRILMKFCAIEMIDDGFCFKFCALVRITRQNWRNCVGRCAFIFIVTLILTSPCHFESILIFYKQLESGVRSQLLTATTYFEVSKLLVGCLNLW